ncbi:hypothetical protein GC089_03940 [Cellulomonas sp. JZ18]|uniref:hypothetical protein n=1 Tax=Cellulomonas sp. JZ18 TaxID=2654191 RepID=UPI0012D40612|nr:hypothetical protein [Cellulomonas sp. JZ18]QGQ18560.1 hypothetical protein GC089_03940 [Cellulomonas sp. JZ18]
MSTSDPQRPAGPGRGGTGEPSTDTGRHAVARPVPTPPEPLEPVRGSASAPGATGPAPAPPGPPTTAATHPETSATPARAAVADPAGSQAVGARPSAAPSAGPAGHDVPAAAAHEDAPGPNRAGPRDGDGDDDLFPDPNAPRTAHAGTHVLGVLVGLVLAPVAALLTLVGQSRILTVQAGDWDASLEVLGIVLVSVGVVLLAAVLLLALWTPAVALTGGAVLGLLGGLALYAPGIARQQVLALVDADAWYRTTVETTVAATSGTLLLAGVLLLVAGLVAAVARRRGVHLGVFRERNRAA